MEIKTIEIFATKDEVPEFTAVGNCGPVIGLVVASGANIRTFANSLACELALQAFQEKCEFIVIDKISDKEYRYEVTRLSYDPIEGYDFKVDCTQLPPVRTIHRKFYNLFSGKSRPKEK